MKVYSCDLINILATLYLLGYLFVIMHLLKPVSIGRVSFFTLSTLETRSRRRAFRAVPWPCQLFFLGVVIFCIYKVYKWYTGRK